MSGIRVTTRIFSIEPAEHRNGHWRLLIGSHTERPVAPTTFILTDDEVDCLAKLLTDAPTTGRKVAS